MAKTGKNFGLYMQNQLLLGIVLRLVSFQLHFQAWPMWQIHSWRVKPCWNWPMLFLPKLHSTWVISYLLSLNLDSDPSKTVDFNSDKNVVSATDFYVAEVLGRHILLWWKNFSSSVNFSSTLSKQKLKVHLYCSHCIVLFTEYKCDIFKMWAKRPTKILSSRFLKNF